MSSFLSVTGTVTQIQPNTDGTSATYGCSLTMTIQTFYQGVVVFTVSGDTYVVDNARIQTGDQVTVFYDANAPVPLIYPPRYRAVVIAKSGRYQYYLGEFYNNFVSTDQTIRLNSDAPINFLLPNGQTYYGALVGKTALVEYTVSTRSIPALVTPNRVIIFCYA